MLDAFSKITNQKRLAVVAQALARSKVFEDEAGLKVLLDLYDSSPFDVRLTLIQQVVRSGSSEGSSRLTQLIESGSGDQINRLFRVVRLDKLNDELLFKLVDHESKKLAHIKNQAMNILIGHKHPDILDRLIKKLEENRNGVGARSSIIEKLGSFRDQKILPLLASELNNVIKNEAGYSEREKRLLRSTTIDAITSIGGEDAFHILLSTASIMEIPKQAFRSNPEEVKHLLGYLTDQNRSNRNKAAQLFGQLGHPIAIPGLTYLLDDLDAQIASEAQSSLGKLKAVRAIAPLIQLAGSSDSGRVKSVISTLKGIGNLGVMPLFEGLLRAEDPSVVIAAIDGIVALKLPNLTAIRQLLTHENIEVRIKAINVLSELNDFDAIPGLRKTLEDPEPKVVVAAIKGLVKLETTNIETIKNLASDEDLKVREASLWALGTLKNESFVSVLRNALEDPNQQIVSTAVSALATVASVDSIQIVESLLSSENPATARLAIKALGELRDENAVPSLQDLLARADSKTAVDIIGALTSIGTDRAFQVAADYALNNMLEKSREIPVILWRNIFDNGDFDSLKSIFESTKDSQTKTRMLPALISLDDQSAKKYLQDQKSDEQFELVAPYFGEFDTKSSADVLIRAYEDQRASQRVKSAAKNALSKLTNNTAREFLETLSDSNNSHLDKGKTVDRFALQKTILDTTVSASRRIEALSSLAQLGEKEAIDFIKQRVIEDPDLFSAAGYQFLASSAERDFLWDRLQFEHDRHAEILDASTARGEQANESELEPLSPWLFELGFALAQQNENDGLRLLSDEFSEVREGAAIGLALKADAKSLMSLVSAYENEDKNIIRRRTYKGITTILKLLEYRSSQEDANTLDQALTLVPCSSAIHARLAWSRVQIRENLDLAIDQISACNNEEVAAMN